MHLEKTLSRKIGAKNNTAMPLIESLMFLSELLFLKKNGTSEIL